MKTLHKKLFVLAILIAHCISASAIEFTVNGVRYSVNDDNTTVTVAGYPSDSKPTGDLTIPDSVTFGGISFPITSIGNLAFSGCSGLTSVTIPNSVTSIGGSAFSYCSGLTSVTIPNSVTSIGEGAFRYCSGLTNVTIGNSVTSIGYYAFDGTAWYNNQPDGLVYAGPVAYKYKGTMPSGTSIVLKEGTKGIAALAFYECSGLTSVTIPSTVKYIGGKAFSCSNELTELVWNADSCNIASSGESSHPFYSCPIMKLIVGDEVQHIPSYLMYKQIFLKSVTIPNSVTSIGGWAFDGCTGLTSVVWNAKNCSDFSDDSRPFKDLTNIKTFEFGSEVERIPARLCYGLTGLTSVTIGNSVTSIGDRAFRECSGLTSVTIGNSVTSIGYQAFYKCSGLTSVTIPNSVTSIGAAFWGCSGLTSVTIPNSVTSIGECAFRWCSGLTSVTIGNSVTSIGGFAFDCCSGLTSVTIPNSVTSIGQYAFSYCSGLTSVTIGNSVTSIGGWAFRECSGLTRIDAYPNPEKVSLGGDVFYGVPKDGTLHVLPKYLSAYRTTRQWREFSNIKGDLTEIGDINLDGNMDVTDVTTLMNMILNSETANLELADINADGKVNVSDVAALINIILK